MEHITSIDAALDLCGRLLRLDSTQRVTAAAALRHKFLGDPADDGPDELLHYVEGKCGDLHSVTDDGIRGYPSELCLQKTKRALVT